MYVLGPDIKRCPARYWAMSDRIFFGHGACHILAGVYLQRYSEQNLHALWIKPHEPFRGNHIFVSNGKMAFDYHGHCSVDRLLAHHKKGWESQYKAWRADIVTVNFSLLSTDQLNTRNMRGPDQYFGNVIERAERYLHRIDQRVQMQMTRTLV